MGGRPIAGKGLLMVAVLSILRNPSKTGVSGRVEAPQSREGKARVKRGRIEGGDGSGAE